jgi:hypothetical protein
LRDVIRIGGNRDADGKCAGDPGTFSVDGSREYVVAIEAAEGRTHAKNEERGTRK